MTALLLVAALALLLGNAFFVAAEFAAVSVRRAQLEPLAAASRRARRVLAAQQQLSLLLAGAQLGITLCSLGLGAVAEPAVAVIFEDLFHALGVPRDLNHPLAFTIALAVVVLAHMVLGEMVPKNIALATSERAAMLLVPALESFVVATGPVIRGLNALANAGLRLARIDVQDELKSAYTPDELAEILAESRDEGYLDAVEHRRLSSALQLAERTAADVTIPHADLVTVTHATTNAELEALTAATGFSRFPVRDNSDAGTLLGFVHIKDVLTGTQNRDQPWPAEQLHAMPSIPADSPLPGVITTLRRARSHLGHVTGASASLGVLALEDVVEELVGEISDASHIEP